jgi:phasin
MVSVLTVVKYDNECLYNSPRRIPDAIMLASTGSAPMNETPRFESSFIEMPAAMRALADKGVEQAREYCERMKSTARDVNSMIEASYLANAKGATDFGLKVIDIMRTNTLAAFSFADKLLSAQSPMEAIAISSDHARVHLETMAAKIKELSDLAQKAATDGTSTIKDGVTTGSWHRPAHRV